MNRGLQGNFISQNIAPEPYKAFIPKPLPVRPPLEVDGDTLELLQQANLALGRLDAVPTLLPDTMLFLYYYVRKEAVLSSQIEGTQSSLSDLLLLESREIPGVPLDDVQEVTNYAAALDHGLTRLREGFPLSLRLLREIHAVLLSSGRGSEKQPGDFRKSPVWIGGSRPGNARYVPPPYDAVISCMGELEYFLHDKDEHTPTLIKAALAHVQFETIHPFLDGNGRLGRLLITFLLCAENVLSEPLLYLSLYFKMHRQTYYELLQRVRLEGDWEAWIRFFLQGVAETAAQAVGTAQHIMKMFEQDHERISALGGTAGSVLQVHGLLRKKPILPMHDTVDALPLSHPTIMSALRQLEKMGIVYEMTGRKRNRVFVYREYLHLLNEGTEPLKS